MFFLGKTPMNYLPCRNKSRFRRGVATGPCGPPYCGWSYGLLGLLHHLWQKHVRHAMPFGFIGMGCEFKTGRVGRVEGCKTMVNLRDFPFYCIVWVGNMMTPVVTYFKKVSVIHLAPCSFSLRTMKCPKPSLRHVLSWVSVWKTWYYLKLEVGWGQKNQSQNCAAKRPST